MRESDPMNMIGLVLIFITTWILVAAIAGILVWWLL